MNKKLIISLGLLVAVSTTAVYAENTTIYTDGLGRMHFLGRDGGNGAKYTNPAEQDLTRRLYEKSAGDLTTDDSYNQHPLKNYENTFPDSRFTTNRKWKPKTEEEAAANSAKTVVTTTKGETDYTGQYQYGSTFLQNNTQEENVVKTSTKKHSWNKKSK